MHESDGLDVWSVPKIEGVMVTRDRGTRVSRGVLATYIIGSIAGADHQCMFGRTKLDLPRGSVFLVEPGYTYDSIHAPGQSLSVAFLPDQIDPSLWPGGKPPSFGPTLVNNPALAGVYAAAFTTLTSQASLLERQTRLCDLVAAVFGEATARHDRWHPSLARAREILFDRMTENVTLDELAHECDMNKFVLLRSFRKTYGMPPHQYQAHARTMRGLALLARGEPATRVAHELGFSDQSHFNRWFKRMHGLTPGDVSVSSREIRSQL